MTAVTLVLLPLAGCGGGGAGDARAAAESGADLPVSRPTGPVDRALARRGEQAFRTRGCVACHTLGEGRKVGPDLDGVTDRRSFEWLYHMVLEPDSMVKNDSIARSLLQQYYTPMSDQNVSPEQFRAIYEYLRSTSEEAEARQTESGRRQTERDDAARGGMEPRRRTAGQQTMHHVTHDGTSIETKTERSRR